MRQLYYTRSFRRGWKMSKQLHITRLVQSEKTWLFVLPFKAHRCLCSKPLVFPGLVKLLWTIFTIAAIGESRFDVFLVQKQIDSSCILYCGGSGRTRKFVPVKKKVKLKWQKDSDLLKKISRYCLFLHMNSLSKFWPIWDYIGLGVWLEAWSSLKQSGG